MRPAIIDRRRLLLGLAAGTALLSVPLLATAPLPARAATDRKGASVVTTTAHVADLVRAVAGDRLRVDSLLGEGIDPHSYKLTRTDTGRLLAADAVLFNGLLLEGKMADTFARMASAGKPVLAVAEAIPVDRLLTEEGGAPDPHVWMDPALWTLALDAVRDALIDFDPAGADAYRANADTYRASLTELDAYARKALTSVPKERRVLVTAHDAFSYLGRAYDMEVVGIQGISTESEAGLRRIEELVAMLVDRTVPAVFVETSVTDRNVRALIDGAAARGHKVVIGGSLFSDAMGAPGTYEGTYLGMMDHNVTVISQALGGDAPAGGWRGRLAAAR